MGGRLKLGQASISALSHGGIRPQTAASMVDDRIFLENLNGVADLLDDEGGELLAHSRFRLIQQSLSE